MAPNPFDELDLRLDASDEELQRAYRGRVIERHRRGVWRIAEQLRRAQRAFGALSDPAAREQHRREAQRRRSEAGRDHQLRQARALDMLRSYKARMNDELERIAEANRQEHCVDLEALERELEREERRAAALLRRRRLLGAVRDVLLIALIASIVIVLWQR